MNLQKIIAPVRSIVAKTFGLSEFARGFIRGDDITGSVGVLRRAYAQSVWVMSAINQVTQPLKAVSLKFYSGDKEVENPALAQFWRSPARGLSYEEFIDATAGHYKLHGEFFWLLDDTWVRPGRRLPSQLIIARPEDMREIVRGGQLEGWVWRDAAGQQISFLPEDVIHIKRWNPFNPWRGLGELEAARMAAETDFMAARFARDTYANQGEAGDYLVAKAGLPTQEQMEQITQQLRAKRAAKLRGDFRPMVLSADLEPKSPQLTTPDVAFAQNRLMNRHEVYIAFGVPASMADVQASYSIGSASDYFRLIFTTCMPLGMTIGGAIESLAQRMTGAANIEAWFDWDEHPVMQAVRGERVDSAIKLWGTGMPMQRINEYLDMGLPAFPGWEKGYLPFSVAEVGGTPDPVTDPSLAEDPALTSDPVQEMVRALKSGCQSCVRDSDGMEMVSSVEGRDTQRVALWKSHIAKRNKTARAFETKFTRVLMEARREVLTKLENASESRSIAKAVAGDFIFDLNSFRNRLWAEMRKASTTALIVAGKELFEEVGKDDPFTMPSARALQFLNERMNLMTDVADDVFHKIKGSLSEGLTAGESIADLATRIRSEFNDISKAKSTTIAQTETAAAYGVARDEAMKQAGIQYKQWLTSGNENVRASHLQAERQIVPIDEPFLVGGVELMFPGDPSGPPEEVINCHCIQIAVAEPS